MTGRSEEIGAWCGKERNDQTSEAPAACLSSYFFRAPASPASSAVCCFWTEAAQRAFAATQSGSSVHSSIEPPRGSTTVGERMVVPMVVLALVCSHTCPPSSMLLERHLMPVGCRSLPYHRASLDLARFVLGNEASDKLLGLVERSEVGFARCERQGNEGEQGNGKCLPHECQIMRDACNLVGFGVDGNSRA